ncbi:MAG: hypothetical protein KAT74_07130, partial [Candidatus Cloacimonetes bacterium]|nr:hypothetical protein [Candidatus Cloacimonadota bacterium]
MKNRMLFLVTFLMVLFSVNLLFAERVIGPSNIAIDPNFLAANPTYTPGSLVSIPFVLNNESPDSADVITAASMTFPVGVTVIVGPASGNPVPDSYDFQSYLYDGVINFEFLDYTGEFGDGAQITYQAPSVPNAISYASPGDEAGIQPIGGPWNGGVVITIDSLFTGPIVVQWTLTSAGIGGTPNFTNGYTAWGPPYGIATFNTTTFPTGLSGEWIVGDTLCLEVTTIGVADTVRVDLTPFGGPTDFQLTQDLVDDSLWAGCFVVPTGSSDGIAYTIIATAYFPVPAAYDTEVITGLAIDNILPNVTDWGSFTVTDMQPPDSNNIADFNFGDGPPTGDDNDDVTYNTGTETTGDGIVWFIEVGTEFAGDFDSSVLLTQPTLEGTLNWLYWDPPIEVSDNAGNTVIDHAMNPDSLAFLDNDPPNDPDTTYFEVNPVVRAIQYAAIGDTIRAVVDITGLQPIVSGMFDFTALNPGPPPPDSLYMIPGIIVGNLIYADYIVQSGDNEILTPPGLIVYATLIDSAGNFSEPPIEIGGTTGDSLFVDGTAPIVITDIENTGYLRFSPDTDSTLADYTDLTNIPDTLLMSILLEDWGEIGGPDEFVIRIEQEYLTRDEPNPHAYKTYHIGDPDVWYEETEGPRAWFMVYFWWDGVIPLGSTFGTPGDLAPEGIYGFTLWSVTDGAGNEGVLDHVVEHDIPQTPGDTQLNRIHGVIDNTPPEYLQELDVYGVATDAHVDTIFRYINDVDYSGTVNAGDILMGVDQVYFQFGVTRDFTENTEALRRENVTYWIEVAGPDTMRIFWGDEDGSAYPGVPIPQGVDPGTFVEYDTEDAVLFGSILDVNAIVGLGKDIKWIADDTGGMDDLLFKAGTYNVTSMIRDNAGNIREGLPTRATVELVDILYTAPTLTRLEIVSFHDDGLPPYDVNGHHNFYLDSSYDTLRVDYYYDTDDLITVELELADITYLDSVVVENFWPYWNKYFNQVDLPTYFPGDFVGNVLTFSYDASEIDETFAWDSLYIVGDVPPTTPGLALNVEIYDTIFGLMPGTALADSFNLIRPEQPVWPDSSSVTLTLSDDRISPGWWSHSYDAEDNPARDLEQDDVDIDIVFDFNGEILTVGFDWFLAIDIEPIDDPMRMAFSAARFSRTDSLVAGDSLYTIPTITFYGLQNNITLPPLVGELLTEELFVSAYAIAHGYSDGGYVDPPGMSETIVVEPLWIDNTNPGLLQKNGDPLISWEGDDNYWGHLYPTDKYMSVSWQTTSL